MRKALASVVVIIVIAIGISAATASAAPSPTASAVALMSVPDNAQAATVYTNIQCATFIPNGNDLVAYFGTGTAVFNGSDLVVTRCKASYTSGPQLTSTVVVHNGSDTSVFTPNTAMYVSH